MLGIIGAMDVEVAEVKEAMQDVEVKTMAGMDFYKGTLRGKEAVVVRSGIGKVNAAVCTQILVDHYGVDADTRWGRFRRWRNSHFRPMKRFGIWL